MDLARNYKTFSAIIIILYFCSYVTACKPDAAKHSAMIEGLKKNGFLKTAAAERSMQGVDRSCFVDDEPYENRSKIVEVGRHPPVKVMFPAPYVHALILDALSAGIKERSSHALVVELGIGYMTACTALMTGTQGVTVSAQPTSDLFSWVSSHVKSWLEHSRAYTRGLTLGNQIKLTTYNNKIPELLTEKYDAVFVRAVRESDVNRWLPRLKTGGIMVCLVGYNGGKQELYQLRRLSETSVQKKTLMNFQDFKPTVTQPKEESVVQPIYVTACKPDEKKHSAMIEALKKNGFLKTAAAEKSMRGVDRSCFVDDEPYENRSQLVEVGRHHPVKVMFPAPYVHALILDALSTGIKERSHALVVELGIGYMTACTALMTGTQGVTVSAQPNSDLFSWVSSHIKSWLDNSRAYTRGLSLGNQIKLTTYNNKIPELLTEKYDAIFVRAVLESDVSRMTLMNFKDFIPTVTPSKEEAVVQPIPPE
ncbi:unnamed protein product [Trichobilharzia szidati]|nr:unnamed protein product [Trichobilharzia szidati]